MNSIFGLHFTVHGTWVWYVMVRSHRYIAEDGTDSESDSTMVVFPQSLTKIQNQSRNWKFAAENDSAILQTSNCRRVSQYSHWWSSQALPATITVDRLPQTIVSTGKVAHNFTLPIPENRTVAPGHYYLCIPNRTTFWHALSEMAIWLYNLLMLSSRWY